MEFLNTITLVGMPPHSLALKVDISVILLKNLDAALGLCNGTHLIIWHLAQKLIVTQIISGTHARNIFNIPHITMTTNRSKWSFTLQRR
jgi:ATP-dependent DNA helicase PIF1